MTKKHTFQGQPRHELQKAYQVIFGRDPGGTGMIIERENLARTFRERAYQLRPDRARELGRSREELSAALKTVALAFDLLADVVGEAERVWVSPPVDDRAARPARPWAPSATALPSTPVAPGTTRNEVEDATRRIKEALGKLREQTERLAQGKPSAVAKAGTVETQPVRFPSPDAEDAPSHKSLILGRHLHRRGLITLRQLIAAVAWQRAQRPAVGQIAKTWGILDDDQIHAVLKEKAQGELFCDFAVRMGWMTPFQRLAVVGRQRVMQKPIGSYFVEQGILTEEQIEAEVSSLRELQAPSKRKAG